MTPDQISDLVTCSAVVLCMAVATFLHFKGAIEERKRPFEHCTKSYYYLQTAISRANWLQLNELWLEIGDFAERYSGRFDEGVFKKYLHDLRRDWYRRRNEVRPRAAKA